MKLGSNVGVLRVGSTAVAAVKRGTARVYDADVAAFQKASDAADVTGIMDLVDYLKGQSLWGYARFYPMKSSQNAGSGSTVYGLGGLTSNNMTLVNSPTWGSGGVTFNGSTQYGKADVVGIGSANEVLFLLRSSPLLASAPDQARAIFCGLGNLRATGPSGTAGLLFGHTTGASAGETWTSQYTFSEDEVPPLRRLGTSLFTWDAEEDYTTAFQLGNSSALWKNKTPISLNRNNTITPSTALGPSDIGLSPEEIFLSGYKSDAVETAASTSGVATGLMIFASTAQPTTTQRETITDLINAL
jgi:hypothetical protein